VVRLSSMVCSTTRDLLSTQSKGQLVAQSVGDRLPSHWMPKTASATGRSERLPDDDHLTLIQRAHPRGEDRPVDLLRAARPRDTLRVALLHLCRVVRKALPAPALLGRRVLHAPPAIALETRRDEKVPRSRRFPEHVGTVPTIEQGLRASARHGLKAADACFHHGDLIAALLVPGGIFAWNSAFYEGTSTDETLRFGRLWIRRAAGWLRKEHPEVLFAREAKTIALQWLPPEMYEHLLHASGFGRVEITQERVMMSLDGLRDLGQYELFIEGALPGIPLAWGAAALGTAVYQAGRELEMTEVPRLWLQMIATKAV